MTKPKRARGFDGASLADELQARLAAEATAKRAAQEKAYLKSSLEHLGATVPDTRKILAAFAKEHRPSTHDELWSLVDALWSKPVYERRSAAMMLLGRLPRLLDAADLPRLERLLREAKTWALVDEIAVHTVGGLVAAHPSLASELDRWSSDDDFWIRRSALLALLRPLREGGGDWPRFTRYADAMLEETEFFIRKAIGWILRDVSKKRPALVVEWVAPRAKRLSGVTWREVVRRLPAKDQRALQKIRDAMST